MCDGSQAAGQLGSTLAKLYSLERPPEGDVASGLQHLTGEGLIVWQTAG
jgi:hypothetical protein